MLGILGIDIGSTTAKAVVIAESGEVLHAERVRHAGRARQAAQRLAARARERFELARCGIAGSIGLSLASELGATPIHEVHALTLAVHERHAECKSIVELGGQDAKVIFLGSGLAGDDVQMNDRCAAGTGATIDRIARRIGMTSEALALLRLCGNLRVAAKCGVFAETDIVNLLQSGASHDAAMSALARAIVVQNLAVLTRGRLLAPPLLLLGGPHAHWPLLVEAWREALHALWQQRGVASGPIDAPRDGDLYVALGAAHHALVQGRAAVSVHMTTADAQADDRLLSDGDDRSLLTALRRQDPPACLPSGAVDVHLGIDAGSTSMKCVAIDRDGQLLASSYGPSTGRPLDDARARLGDLFDQARKAHSQLVVCSLGVTGYGAALLGPLLGADIAPVETLAHAAGARAAFPQAQVVVDVGGTDIKVMRLQGADVAEFFVSNQCSAGHGAFLASSALDMGVKPEHFAERALAATRAPRFSVGCAVFMDSDRVTFARDGYKVDEILAGLSWTLARNVWEFVVPRPPEQLGTRFVLCGGAQRNLAAAFAQAKYLHARVAGCEVVMHPTPELCGALGAALLACAHVTATRAATRFRGLSRLATLQLHVQADASLRCERCTLGCERSRVTLDEGASKRRSWLQGNACERGAEEASTAHRGRGHAPDLFGADATQLFRWPTRDHSLSLVPRRERSWPVLAIPRVMCMYRAAPLVLGYLEAAGMPREHVLWSPTTSAALFQDGARRGMNDPCFPAKLVHAHVDALLRMHAQHPFDALFLPAVTHASVVTTGTADCAACPIVTACGYAALAALGREGDVLGARGIAAISSELCLAEPAQAQEQLYAGLGRWLGLTRDEHQAAVQRALAFARQGFERRRARGARVLADAERRGRAVAVVLARPYHADPGVSHGISTQLAAHGMPVLGIGSLPLGAAALRDLSGVLAESTNSGCAEKVWAARAVVAHPNLVAVDLSSFRCGQDASVLGMLQRTLGAADKPALYVHDLDEDRPTASLALRVQTFLAAVQRYEARALRARATPALDQASC
ncbi:MAG TPA: BadF/BadG/BcrA/BcrD ATPase family protein [Polyangiales bacterium]